MANPSNNSILAAKSIHMKNLILFITITFAINIYSQKIKLKDDKLQLDGKDIFSYKKVTSESELYLYDLETNKEVVYIKLDRNGTFEYDGDNYVKIFFAEPKIKVESKSLHFGGRGIPIVEKLISEGVIEHNGNINFEKAETFHEKYNDNITK